MTQFINKSTIKAEIERLVKEYRLSNSAEAKYRCEAYGELLDFVNSLQEEPVSGDLEEAAMQYAKSKHKDTTLQQIVSWDFKAGAKWKKGNLWKNAQGDDLPEIDREVIALLNNGKVVFAHRPPERWYGRNLDGEEHLFEPETYDKGKWNIPNVVWWLDLDLPIKGK